jgi:hypothetical protein
MTKVEFHLTGGSLNNALVATGSPTYYGWAVYWDSTTVRNGVLHPAERGRRRRPQRGGQSSRLRDGGQLTGRMSAHVDHDVRTSCTPAAAGYAAFDCPIASMSQQRDPGRKGEAAT